MSALQITLGGGTNWMALIVPGAIAGVSTLIGIGLTNWSLARHRKADREHETAERRRVEDFKAGLEARDRGLAGLALANHLESYALHCINVVDAFRATRWDTPNSHDPRYGSPVWLQELGEWPDLVDWKLLGLKTAVEAEQLRRSAELERSGAFDEDASPIVNHGYVSDVAAVLGIRAWSMATTLRAELGLDDFVWPEGWNGIGALEKHLAQRDQQQRDWQQRADELLGDLKVPEAPPKAV